jgi:hypothetical protein
VHTGGNTGTGVKVAIIDTGIAGSHPDLAVVAGGHNFLNNTTSWADDNGHGTHVAGSDLCAAERMGRRGRRGGLPALRLQGAGRGRRRDLVWQSPRPLTGPCTLRTRIRIRVANLSLGGSGHPGTTVEDAFTNAYGKGLVIVASAGNSGNCGGRGDNVGYPARFSSVIAVAATNANDTRPCFSSTGPDVEIAAPGVSVLSTWPGASGSTTQLCSGGSPNTCAYYRTASGTSMASPHVAGVAALVIKTNPDLKNWQVRATLANTAINIGSSNHYGAGLVSAPGAAGVGSPPAPTTGSIAGVVTASGGGAISGASVSVGSNSTTTASNGSYTLSGVPEGNQTLEVSATGYIAASQSVTVVAGDTVSANVTLDPEPVEPPPPPGDPGTVSVTSISYAGTGGPNSDRHLRVTVTLQDDNEAAVLRGVSGDSTDANFPLRDLDGDRDHGQQRCRDVLVQQHRGRLLFDRGPWCNGERPGVGRSDTRERLLVRH